MGLFTDVTQEVNIPVVIKSTKRGGMIVCPRCKGAGSTEEDGYPDYGTRNDCYTCGGSGAIEVTVKKVSKGGENNK